MPLEDSCAIFLGKLVFVLPTIGYGWCRIDSSAPADQPGGAVDTPQAFHAKLIEFQYLDGKIAGGIGTVEELNHPFDKQWVAFCVRDRGTDMYDFTASPGKYNLGIGRNRPTVRIDINIPMPQWMRFEGPPSVGGFGYIGESDTRILEKYSWLK
ncbi:MAG: hypothetical protein V4726_21085 [Verrucomicrobiota bacterium]